jgi:hypothetical protein
VHLCGGTFSAGPLPSGGFQVTATLPLPPADLRAWTGPRTEDGVRTGDGQRTEDGQRTGDGVGADSRATADDSAPAALNGTHAVTGVVTRGGGVRG